MCSYYTYKPYILTGIQDFAAAEKKALKVGAKKFFLEVSSYI